MNICSECRRLIKFWFLSSLIFLVITFNIPIPYALLVAVLAFPVISSIGLWASIIDIIAIVVPFLFFDLFLDNKYVVYLPVIANFLIILNYRAERYMAFIISYSLLIFWIYVSFLNYRSNIDLLLIIYTIFNMIINLKPLLIRSDIYHKAAYLSLSDKYDNIEQVKDLVPMLKEESNCSIRVTEINNIEKDEFLILVFDVSYFLPKFSVISHIIKNMPKGNKRSVLLVYPTDIYPDNGYFIIWLIMVLQGWRVRGRASFINGLSQLKTANINVAAIKDMKDVINYGSADVAEGHISALGNVFYFSPFIFIGFLIHLFFKKIR